MERNTIHSAQQNKVKVSGSTGLNIPAYMQKPRTQGRVIDASRTRVQRSSPAEGAGKSRAQEHEYTSQQRKNPPRRRRASSLTKLLRIAILVLGVMLLAVAALLFIKPGESSKGEQVQAAYDNGTFYPGITINNIDVGGMTMEAAKRAVHDAADKKLDEVNLVLKLGDKEWTLTRNEMTITPDTDEVLQKAFDLGRNGASLAENWSMQSKLKDEGQSFTTDYSVDEEALKQKLMAIAGEAYVAPVEPQAVPGSQEGKFTYNEGQNGVAVDVDALLPIAVSMIQAHDYSQPLTIPTKSEPPTHTLAQVKENTKLISTFSTTFSRGSLKNVDRVHNIEKAADILNGAVVGPGEEFSFNKFVGPRTEKGGWKLAPGIVNGNSYEMQAGGGICQVSTTLYNSLLMGELTILVRKHHSWPSSYVDYGLDATVSTGGPDLVFQNNYDYPIYIFTKFEGKPTYKLTISIYGKPALEDGVRIKLYSKTVAEKQPPEPEIIQDPLQPEGFVEEVITARTGYTVEVYKDYVKGDKVIKTVMMYKESYAAVRGTKRIGTGPPEIPVQPIATPTPMP